MYIRYSLVSYPGHPLLFLQRVKARIQDVLYKDTRCLIDWTPPRNNKTKQKKNKKSTTKIKHPPPQKKTKSKIKQVE